jgi:C4-dicarboxylate-binding protein DctP
LTTAVSQGTVQGFQSTYSFWKIFPNAKYGTNAGTLSMLGYSVLASDRAWNGLTDKQRALISDALKEITAAEIEGVKELDKTDRELLLKQGRQMLALSPAEIKRWKELTEPVYGQYRKEIGNEVMDLLEKQRKH